MLIGNKLVFGGILLVQVMILSSTAYALKVNMEHVRYTDFSDGTKSPYKDCTTQRPNYVRVEEMDGDRVVKLYWTQTGYDGTRMDKGAEGCSKLEIYKEGWQAYKVYLPDPGFPKNKTGSISQIFSLGGCSSWAAMPVVRGNRLTLVHRASCGKAEDAILLEDIPRNEWIQMIYHFRVSQKNDGFLRVWIETLDNIDALDQNKPLFEHIGNFGFGLWDSNDVLQVRPSSDRTNWTDLKFGMYNHSSRDYDQDEERWLFYDDMMNINGNPENAFLMSQGYVNEQGLYDSAVSIKKATTQETVNATIDPEN